MSSTPDPRHDRSTEPADVDPADVDPAEERPDAPGADAEVSEPQVSEPEVSEPEVSEPDSADAEHTTVTDETSTANVATTTHAGRLRLRQVFVKPGRSQIVVGALLAALGFAAVTQVRSTQLDDTYQGLREEELIEIFNGVAGTSDRTRKEIARLEQDRRDLQVDTSARQAAIEQAEKRLETLNMLAGLVPVTGPGLRITITEEAGRISIDSLLDAVQELRTAGAEAIEFNGTVRLVASSSFADVNGVITLDGQELRSPYVIEVIGEPHTLHTGLIFRSGPIATLREDESADVSIEELDSVDIESVRSLPRAEFATPAEGQ